jgi:phosphopantothenoylcysteine decarboxylase/phosphopantothenate--cysteine ligase
MTPPLRILISAGPTREPIDQVRFLSNYSTGFMGHCLAAEAIRRGHRVTFVSGPTCFQPPEGARVVLAQQASQMQAALRQWFPGADVLIMAAAVCDFEPVRLRAGKLPRHGRRSLALKATPDIVGTIPRRPGQLVVGFALEAARPRERAFAKLKRKRLDLIVGQRLPPLRRSGRAGLNGTGSPFGKQHVEAFLLEPSGITTPLGQVSKTALARALLDKIEGLWYGGQRSRRP